MQHVPQWLSRGNPSLSQTDRTPSGIPGLDALLGGGFPRGRVILIVGGVGTGKTIFSAQFLVKGVEEFGEGGLFLSLDESREHLYREMFQFGWNLKELEKKKKLAFIDASPIRHLPGEVKIGEMNIGKRDFSLLSVIEALGKGVESVNAKRIVVDPLAALVLNYPELAERRTAVLDVIEALSNTNATSILTTELASCGMEREKQLEEYLAHGVIALQTLKVGNSFVRAIQALKMRETQTDLQPRPYKISKNGIVVFPNEAIFR